MSWLNDCRRLHRRYERTAEHFLAFVGIASAPHLLPPTQPIRAHLPHGPAPGAIYQWCQTSVGVMSQELPAISPVLKNDAQLRTVSPARCPPHVGLSTEGEDPSASLLDPWGPFRNH